MRCCIEDRTIPDELKVPVKENFGGHRWMEQSNFFHKGNQIVYGFYSIFANACNHKYLTYKEYIEIKNDMYLDLKEVGLPDENNESFAQYYDEYRHHIEKIKKRGEISKIWEWILYKRAT